MLNGIYISHCFDISHRSKVASSCVTVFSGSIPILMHGNTSRVCWRALRNCKHQTCWVPAQFRWKSESSTAFEKAENAQQHSLPHGITCKFFNGNLLRIGLASSRKFGSANKTVFRLAGPACWTTTKILFRHSTLDVTITLGSS